MTIITKIVFFIIIVFTLNIVFYYISDDYRFFIKKVKNSDNVIYIETKIVDDEIKDDEILYDEEIDFSIINNKNIKNIYNTIKEENIKEETNIEKEVVIVKEVLLWKNYRTILNAFNDYDLEELELKSNLFDITDEYPDDYYEYYSKDITLYLFTSRSYDDVKNIMWAISFDIPFEINELNNFLDKSFYINLDESISDSYVRLVISYKSITFWLKIKKDLYNDVKEKLIKIDKPTIKEEDTQTGATKNSST